MRRYLLLPPFLILCAVAWCLYDASRENSAPQPTGSAAPEAFVVGAPVQHGNLTIFPVLSREPRGDDRFITLDEGLAAGTVKVFEVGADGRAARPNAALRAVLAQTAAGSEQDERDDENAWDADDDLGRGLGFADVNRLMVSNSSGKPLYLMPGEVIVGGQQDRSIGEEAIIASSDEPVEIDVFCVEHGRWRSRSIEESRALGFHTSLSLTISDTGADHDNDDILELAAAEAQRGKFIASPGNLNKASRLAVQESKDQGKVWDEVASTVGGSIETASWGTGAFTASLVDDDVRARLDPYVAALKTPVENQPRVVGVIVAINGKPEAVDVFESTPLFKKLWPKLLKSYALDAAYAPDVEKPKACTVAEARAFIQKALAANVAEKTPGSGGLIVTKRETDGVVSFSAESADAAPAMGAFGGGSFGGAVHSSAFGK